MKRNRKADNIKKYVLFAMVVVLYYVSVRVYMIEGTLKPLDAIYYALSLYPISMRDIEDGAPEIVNTLIALLRLMCPLVASAFILSLITDWINWLWDAARSIFCVDSVCVYGTNDTAVLVGKKNRFIVAGEHFHCFARKHVILMDSDEESIDFYRKHAKWIPKKRNAEDNVFIGLRDMSASVTWEQEKVAFFNVQEETARNYWLNNRLYEQKPADLVHRIVILNYRPTGLGYYLLKHGVLNNVFPDARRVCYDVFCIGEDSYTGFEEVKLMNKDILTWHRSPWHQAPEVIRSADRIIIAEDVTPQLLNRLQQLCTNQTIDCYFPEEVNFPETYQSQMLKVQVFGLIGDVLNREAIMKGNQKWLHYRYITQYGSSKELAKVAQAKKNGTEAVLAEELWMGLDSFLRKSNIAQTDYRDYHSEGREMGASKEARARAEHIRWCRFHFLNGWRYGLPSDGRRKDPEQRIHRDLVSWEELPESEKEKNLLFI